MESLHKSVVDINLAINQTEAAINVLEENLKRLKKIRKEMEILERKEKESEKEDKVKEKKVEGKDRLPKVWDAAFGLEQFSIPGDTTLEYILGYLEEEFKDVKKLCHLKKQMNRIRQEAREGDIIDIMDYRGTGYFYLYLKNGKMMASKTQAEYGNFLPREALPILHKFEIETLSQAASIWSDAIIGINLGKVDEDIPLHGYEFEDPKNTKQTFIFRLADHPLAN